MSIKKAVAVADRARSLLGILTVAIFSMLFAVGCGDDDDGGGEVDDRLVNGANDAWLFLKDDGTIGSVGDREGFILRSNGTVEFIADDEGPIGTWWKWGPGSLRTSSGKMTLCDSNNDCTPMASYSLSNNNNKLTITYEGESEVLRRYTVTIGGSSADSVPVQ